MRFHAPAESACAAAMMRFATAAYLAGIASGAWADREALVAPSDSAASERVVSSFEWRIVGFQRVGGEQWRSVIFAADGALSKTRRTISACATGPGHRPASSP